MLEACDLHNLLDLLDPILRVYLTVLSHIGYVGTKHGQRFPAAATDTHQKSMPERSSDDSNDLDDVLNSDHEEYQVHLVGRVKIVVLVKIGLAFLADCVTIGQLAVDIIQGLFGSIAVRVKRRDEASPKKGLDCH